MRGLYWGGFAPFRATMRRCGDAARVGGVTLQIVRDWVLRFNAEGPDGLISRKAPGKASILNDEQRRALIEMAETEPIPASHGVVRWRLIDLAQWVHDEARIGQQTKLTRRWAKRGTRPSAPKDQRRASAWIFGATCPAEGKGAGIILPRCNSEAMSLHLEEIAFHVAPGAHAVLILDQAGWHGSAELVVPANITLMPLPPRCPELNPVENVWQFMRDNWLSNRIFQSHDDIVDHCCFAWNKLIDQP